MTAFQRKISFGFKIYSIAVSILGLLMVLSWFTYNRVALVGNHLAEIAELLIPLEGLISNIDVHTLEQQIHLERMFREMEARQVNPERVAGEKALFQERGLLVDTELKTAEKLIEETLQTINTKEDILELVRVKSILEDIEREHQEFHDHALKIINYLAIHKKETARILRAELEQEEDDLVNEIDTILEELEQFTEKRVRLTSEQENDVIFISAILVAVSLVVGVVYAAIVTLGLMRPVRRLVNGTKDIQKGDLSVAIAVTTHDEIGELTDFFNTMVQEIREKEHIKTTFGQFLDPRIVDVLISKSHQAAKKGEKKNMTVFFSDVAGFSSISELLTAEGLVNLINSYLTLASEPITRSHGVIDKYIGDAVVAFWGEPFAAGEEHAHLACDAALEQFIQLEKLQRKLPDLLGIRKGVPPFNIRIGLATGPLIAGNLGSQELQSYTVLGQAVKYAEDLETLNKQFGTRILISQATRQMVKNDFETREIGQTKSGDTNENVYELISRKGECDPDTRELRDRFEEGLQHYHNRQAASAQTIFRDCLKLKPDDQPTRYYLDAIANFTTNQTEKS